MRMKFYTTVLAMALVFGLTSCEKDNYDAPEAAIAGQITDQNGNPFQTANGKGSMSMRITEISFAHGDESIVVTPQDLNMKQDGSYVNTRLFAGTYEVLPWQGAFFEDEIVAQTVELKDGKTTTVDFAVTPYLNLEWVKEPYLTADNYLEASFKFTRNRKDNGAPDVKDCCIWISRTKYCGTEGDGNYTPATTTITNADESAEITLRSKIPIKYSMKYWIRIGARCNDTYQKYNFTDIKELEVVLN